MEYSKIKQNVIIPGRVPLKSKIIGCATAAILGAGSVGVYNLHESILDKLVYSAKMLPAKGKVKAWSYYNGENVMHTQGVWQRYQERVKKENLNRKPYQPTLLPDLDADGKLTQDNSSGGSLIERLAKEER